MTSPKAITTSLTKKEYLRHETQEDSRNNDVASPSFPDKTSVNTKSGANCKNAQPTLAHTLSYIRPNILGVPVVNGPQRKKNLLRQTQ